MKKVKFDGARWWLYLDYSGTFVPFGGSSFPRLISLVENKYDEIIPQKEYEIPDEEDKIYGQNHGPKCTGSYHDEYHYECAGTGIIATFSDL